MNKKYLIIIAIIIILAIIGFALFSNSNTQKGSNIDVNALESKGNLEIDGQSQELANALYSTDKSDVNVVFPSLNGTAYENLTIDYIIEKMGVPTYVASGDALIPTVRNDANSENIMTFNYYYEYSDYTFVFHFNCGQKSREKSTNSRKSKRRRKIFHKVLVDLLVFYLYIF